MQKGARKRGGRRGGIASSTPSLRAASRISWPSKKELSEWKRGASDQVTTVHFWSRPHRGANFLPWASTDGDQTNDPFYLPQEIKDILGLVPHGEIGDLRAWLVGHILKFLIRPNHATSRALRELHASLVQLGDGQKPVDLKPAVEDWWVADWERTDEQGQGDQPVGEWRHPIAGMHVRRTDHASEAPFRDVKEYMRSILQWWDNPANRQSESQLRVYLATDEPQVAEEVQAQYPDVVFLVTASGGRLSGEGQRSGIDHTQNLLSDLFHLAKCDFFVGTGSSQVSRMTYELQQTYSLDHHNWRSFVSLDAPWYFP